MSWFIRSRGDHAAAKARRWRTSPLRCQRRNRISPQQIIKDPHNIEFLCLGAEMREHELEGGLLEHMRSLILELGMGFGFVGGQYPLEVGGKDYYLDLLFYHLHLLCFVVFELKIEEFAKRISTCRRLTIGSSMLTISHPWPLCFVRAGTVLLWNTHYATRASRWALRNTS
jgi:predicted nuclease of restriction endonuclease-like (RecB) superfamily